MSPDQPVLFVDPGRQVPGYSRALTTALARRLPNTEVTYATAPLLHYADGPMPGVAVEIEFSRRLAGRPSPSPWRRRALKGLAYPFELWRFARRTCRRKPSILHLQWSLLPALEHIAWRRIQSSGIPWIQTVHNVLPHESRPWQAPLLRRLYRGADQLIVHSQHSRERLIELVGPAHPPIEILEMPADPVPILSSEPADRRRARQRLGLEGWLEDGTSPDDSEAAPMQRQSSLAETRPSEPHVPLALFFGHIRPYKGLHLLLEAWPAVLRTLPRARLLVAGHVAGGAAAERRLRRRMAEIDPGGSIRLEAGYVPTELVADHFAAADLVVAPYLDSDHSAVVTAARGYGRAVLVTAVGGLPEALARGGGQLVKPQREAIKDGLIGLLGDPKRIAGYESEARAAARAWTWDDAADATVGIYRRVIAARTTT